MITVHFWIIVLGVSGKMWGNFTVCLTSFLILLLNRLVDV